MGVKLASIPVSVWANRGIAENRSRFLAISSELSTIRRNFRGEEQAEKILALYREGNYKPYLALKSSLVLLSQIPIFVWVFVGVSDSEGVRGQRLWLIDDVSQPDGLLQLGSLMMNLLPLVMLVLSVFNLLHMSRVRKMETSQLAAGWAVALGFFVLLYGSPAALVIYWTANIVLQWLIDVLILLRESRLQGEQ